MTDLERILLDALREISCGSARTGRWLDSNAYSSAIEEPDGVVPSKDQPPEGYYDYDDPPEEDDLDEYPPPPPGVDDPLFVGGRWLKPAQWEDYTLEEQCEWLASVVRIAERAIKQAEALTNA